jgi:LysM repeat protein
MDTISRENNSMLPVGGIIVGVIALLLGGYAAITLSKVNKTLTEQQEKLAKIDAIENAANTAADVAQKAKKENTDLRNQTQNGFTEIAKAIGDLQTAVTKIEETQKAKAVAATEKAGKNGKKGEPATAGPGEYVVKAGDTSGAKIARDHGVSLQALMDVNPGVNWSKLKVGDKLKLPSTASTAKSK